MHILLIEKKKQNVKHLSARKTRLTQSCAFFRARYVVVKRDSNGVPPVGLDQRPRKSAIYQNGRFQETIWRDLPTTNSKVVFASYSSAWCVVRVVLDGVVVSPWGAVDKRIVGEKLGHRWRFERTQDRVTEKTVTRTSLAKLEIDSDLWFLPVGGILGQGVGESSRC